MRPFLVVFGVLLLVSRPFIPRGMSLGGLYWAIAASFYIGALFVYFVAVP